MQPVRSTASYAGRESGLSGGQPESFRAAPSPRLPFRLAEDPIRRREQEANQKAETQRRDESSRGSLMVKLDKPFPDLKPSRDLAEGPVRESFNRAWLREQREARYAEYDRQRAERRAEPERDLALQHVMRGPEH